MEDEVINGIAKQRTDLLDASFPTIVLAALVLVAWAGWVAGHRMKEKTPAGAGRLFFGLVRVLVGAVALWSLWQLSARFLVLASSWPLWLNAFIGSAAIEAAIAAYGFERSTLSERRSRVLLGLRLGAIGIVLLILVQPVFSRLEERKLDREVVVLIDDSESMQLVDRQLPAGERLEIAEFYGVGVEGRIDLGQSIEALRSLERLLQRQQGALTMATGGSALPEALKKGSVEAMGEAGVEIDAQLDFLEGLRGQDGVSGEPKKIIEEARKTLKEKVADGLRKTAGSVAAGEIAVAEAALKESITALRSVTGRLPSAAEAIDAQTYEGLPEDLKNRVDGASERSRAAIARDVLMKDGKEGALSDLLEERYKVRYVRFGRKAAELTSEEYLDSSIGSEAIDLGDAPFETGVFVSEGAAFMSYVPKRAGDSDGWKGADFDEKGWRRVLTPAGYSDDREERKVFRGKLEGQMKRKSSSVYLRTGFEVEEPGRFGDVVLSIQYDDGFVAYLNGEEVARRNVGGGELGWGSRAGEGRGSADVQRRETIVVGQGEAVLQSGRNVLAIHGVNVDKNDNDFYIDLSLKGNPVESEAVASDGGVGSESAESLEFRALTDVVGALSHAAEKIAPDTLAGILLASDGQHNGRAQVEDIARRLGVQGAPVGAVAIGSSVGPPDASILDLQVSDSVYLGDKIVARADVKLDGLRGKSVRAVLVRDGEDLDEVEIRVPSDRYRTNLRFKHVPDDKGIYSYSVRLDRVDGELFRDNNDWHFDVAVTDDRKNVLLVDSFPRWEFRYLRNLFFARDKSVHLQYVVLHPEAIEGQEPLPEVAASASRPFGDAEATRLPESREEWLKFDAIILGDVPPAVFGQEQWEIIDECVRERGAMLVVVAGPRYMPHAYSDERFKELLPVLYTESEEEQFEPAEPGYRLALTPEGRNSGIMRQAPSGLVNAQIWGGMPELRWRHVLEGVKEGGEVLAYAEIDGERTRAPGEGFAGLFEERQAQRKAALIATQRYAMGSVCALMFDRTWRFRYGVGDTYHHRFWGQLMRWGTGENLRVGTEFVRMGSDQLSYEPGERVRIIARVSTPDYRPVIDDKVRVAIYREGERIAGRTLDYRPGSNGIYEAEMEPFREPGRYRMVLEGGEASEILEADGIDELGTEFLVESAKNAIELSELTVDRDFLNKTAALSDGRVVGVGAAASLIDLFGEPSKVVEERLETTLWDTWPVLLLFVGVVTAEWVVRRRGGLV